VCQLTRDRATVEKNLWFHNQIERVRQCFLPDIEREKFPGIQFFCCGDMQDIKAATAYGCAM
jgi:hypothetical protein